MEFIDARRLTGPSLIFDGPGAVLEVACSAAEAERLLPLWQAAVSRMLNELGWDQPQFASRQLIGGISMAFSAPIDALYAASEVNEWAWSEVVSELGVVDVEASLFDAAVSALKAAIAEESNERLMQLIEAADANKKTLLWDDDEVSVGLGRGSQTWPVREIPDEIDWQQFHDVPVGLVTGTNGKTTTVRMATHIARTADHNVGLSSTDWIAVNDDIIERGDWSGPGGARAVLREQSVDVAILESARGGLLRRGLGVNRADAALITNIAEDHLGDFGSRSLAELLDVKWIVSRAVRQSGVLILNADDALLRAKATEFDGELRWFGLDAESEFVAARRARGDTLFVLDDNALMKVSGDTSETICLSHEIPITLGGLATHNVANALSAAALTDSLGYSLVSIRDGLTSMGQEENPGRCNIYSVGEFKVLVDFAHNPAAMHALFDMAQAIPAQRRVLCFGQAGDRPDSLIRDMTRDAWAIELEQVMVSELADYHRGRDHGDVFALIEDELLECGADATQIRHFEEEIDAFNAALKWAQKDDLVIMLALGDAASIQQRLTELGAK